MGAKHASVHLRCDDETIVLEKLKGKFDREKARPAKKDLLAMELIKAIASKNVAKISDPAEKAEKKAILSQIMGQAKKDMEAGDPAVIAVREHFVSIYWYDHIRIDNLYQEMMDYAALCGVPAMGVGIYDDTNFYLYAVRNAKTPKACGCRGEYLFDYDDITPVTAGEVCRIIDAPFLLEAFHKTLSCSDGENMASVFEEETELPILMGEAACKSSGMRELERWKNAVVFGEAYWTNAIKRELEKLESGDIRALLTSYCAFAVGSKKLMRRTGHSIRQQLENRTLAQMIRLYERFRMFTSLEWSIDWSAVPLQPILEAVNDEDQAYVLILGTFHPNGYFRERCMDELAKVRGALPYLMLRANDWAEPVRERAFFLLDRYISQCSVAEILSAMPVLEKLQRSGRRSDGQLEKLKNRISACVDQAFKSDGWMDIWPEDFSVRKSLYRLAIERRMISIEQMDEWLLRENDSCGMRILIKGILTHPDCTLARAAEYLSYPSVPIRKSALEYRYEHLKESWPGLPAMLLDSGRSVREYAAYILERHTHLDIREYYLEHLKDKRPEYAILGLSEYSCRGNVDALLPGLGNPEKKVQKYTLLALGRQEDFEDEELLWNYLLDERADISKAACLSIQKRGFYPGAERIYHAYCSSEKEHQKRYLLRLLLRENSWNRLPWLIRIYSEALPEQEKRLARGGIACRFMYAKVPDALKEEIRRALKEAHEKLPEGMEEQILYDMRFV